MIQKIVTEPIQKGKFDKQIKQIGPNYSIRNLCVGYYSKNWVVVLKKFL